MAINPTFNTRGIVLHFIQNQTAIQGHATLSTLFLGISAPPEEIGELVERLADEGMVKLDGKKIIAKGRKF